MSRTQPESEPQRDEGQGESGLAEGEERPIYAEGEAADGAVVHEDEGTSGVTKVRGDGRIVPGPPDQFAGFHAATRHRFDASPGRQAGPERRPVFVDDEEIQRRPGRDRLERA